MNVKLVVTYKGNIVEKLKRCGTRTDFHLLPNGNTEQVCDVFARPDSPDGHFDFLKQIMLEDAQKNGEVVSLVIDASSN